MTGADSSPPNELSIWRTMLPKMGLILFPIGFALAPQVVIGTSPFALVGIAASLVIAYAWNPVAGIQGDLSLAHVVSWGGGCYVIILLVREGISWPFGLIGAALVGAVIAGIVVAVATLAKLEGLYVAVFSVVFVFFSVAVVNSSDLLGGASGMSLAVLPMTVSQSYYVLAGYALILLLLNRSLRRSRRGLVWLAMSDDPSLLPTLGRSVGKERAVAYTVSGALCGIGGALYTLVLGFTSPEVALDLHLFVVALLAIYIGGAGNWWGPLVGVLFLEGLRTAVSGQASAEAALYTTLGQYIIALALYVVVRSQRQRIAGFFRHRRTATAHRRRAVAIEPAVKDNSPQEAAAIGSKPGPVPSEQLEAVGLQKHFDGLAVLKNVSFALSRGEILGLVGPNGAGKSTICNIIAGSLAQDRGKVLLGARSSTDMTEAERTRAGLGRTFQTPRIFMNLTLGDNLRVAGADRPEATLHQLGLDPQRLGARATLMERRLVEIARLMCSRPRWALMDEPLAGLDPMEQQRALGHIRDLRDAGTGVLIIEHLVPVIAEVVDRMIVLDVGRLIADGAPREVLLNRQVVEAYLGEPLEIGSEGVSS